MVGVSSVLIIDDAAQLLGDAANSYKLARRQVMTLLPPLMRKMLQLAKFTDVVNEFDSMTPLDTWKTTLLLRMKERLKAKELEEDDLT